MFLKQIELYGFKSFCEKTVLKFSDGVTAIVGPNGVGKSNIQEAIKWVLGEQNPRELRGQEMQDVIFNGTADVPSIGLAEVSLTLDNSTQFFGLPYDPVVVSRRLYRSGESEYFINKIPVRLKDITDLIAGTGMGTSAYAIMEQGKIDQVLSAKPEERREIFEEASGITKYKVKEKEAMRRLSQTEENLSRIRDIVLEVKRQISSIERQVAKAQKYQSLYDQLKKLEIALGGMDYRAFQQKKVQAQENKSKFEVSLQQLDEQVNSLTHQDARSRGALENQRRAWEEKEKEWAQLEANFELSRDRVKMEYQTQKDWENQRERLSTELSESQDRMGQINQQIKQVELEEESLKVERQRKEKQIALMEQTLQAFIQSLHERENQISEAQTRVADLLKRKTDLANELLSIVHQKQNLVHQESRLVKQREQANLQLLGWEQEKKFLLKSQQEVQSQVEQWRKKELKNSEKLASLRTAHHQFTEEHHQKENQLTSFSVKIQFLEDLKTRYEGFSEAVKFLLAGGSAPREGIFDCIANLIDVEPGYELALEAALGEQVQTILVDRVQTALKALESVTGLGKGKVTFLPLEWVVVSAGGSFHEKKINFPAKPLMEVVHCQEQIRPAIEYLVRDVFVVDRMDASILSEIELSSCRFVTREGRLAGNGFISGGNSSKTETPETTLVGRESRIRQFKAQSQEVEQQIGRLRGQLDLNQKEIAELENEWTEATQKISHLEKRLTQQQLGAEELERRIQLTLNQQELLDKELSQLIEEQSQLEKKEKELQVSISEIEKRQQQERQQLEELQKMQSRQEKEREENQLAITEMKTELSSLSREAEKQKQTQRFLMETLSTEQESQKKRQAGIGQIQIKIDQSKEAVLELEKQAQQWQAKREQFQKELGQFQMQYSELENELKSIETQVRAANGERQQIQESLHQKLMDIQGMDMKIEHLLLRLREAYQVEVRTLEEVQLECQLDEAGEQLHELRQKVQQIGPVNLAALEEHQELSQRFEFLTHQEQDLVKARESLLSTIQKIHRTTRILFRETFEKIQVYFQEFFTKLFGGGQTQLVLMDQEEILESGIDVMVRPPGKKLQNISLLSGGERALTATALLFALFKSKPSPFCILDELDAPLDEANIDRFCDTLKELTQQSQFLIITHNKKTMTIADTLYGVTMEHPGISRIISVKMTKPPEPAQFQEPEPVLA